MARDGSGMGVGVRVDLPLLAAIAIITTAGLVNLNSAVSVYVGSTKQGSLAEIYVTQVYWVGMGLAVAALLAAIDYRQLERFSYVFYVGGILLLGLVLVFGEGVRGAKRWIFNIQPSEFMKIGVIMALAKYLHNDPKTDPRTLLDLIPPGVLMAVPVALVMAQPDLGTSLIYVACGIAMLGMTRIARGTVVSLLAALVVGIPLAWAFVLKDYQKARVTSFLDPEHDTSDTGWHALQSRTAIGNGGGLGEGYLQGTQNQFGFLPDQYSDFPFSVWAEEFGFVGSVALLAVYAFICIWAVHVASEAKDRFGAALAIGVGAMFFAHTVFNVGMASGVLPVVGVTLPLFSYGGSSVLTMFMGLGLLLSVSMRR